MVVEMRTQMDKKSLLPSPQERSWHMTKMLIFCNIAKQMLNYSMVSHTVYPGLLKINNNNKKTLHYGLEFRGKNKKVNMLKAFNGWKPILNL